MTTTTLPRGGDCVCGHPVAEHFDAKNRTLTCLEVARRTRRAPATPRQIESPYLTAREAMAYLRVNSKTALYRLVNEHGMPCGRRGNLYLFDRRELDAWVHGTTALELLRKRA